MAFEGDLLEDHPLIRNRYEKAEALREAGHSPFVKRFEPTHKAGPLQADGSMISMPLEDMSPLLPRDEFRANMLVPLDPASEAAPAHLVQKRDPARAPA